MELSIPDTVQFEIKVPRTVDPKLVGQLPHYHYNACFTHAVKAVMVAGLRVECTLKEDFYSMCDFCHESYIKPEQGWEANKPLLDGVV